VTSRLAGRAIALAPLVGLLLGGVAAALLFLSRLVLGAAQSTSLLPPLVALATLALLTRGLHLDGLADTADGLGAGCGRADPARALEIMHRGNTGPFGVAAIVFVVGGQAAALRDAVWSHHGTVALLVSVVAARVALPVCCVAGTPAPPGSRLGATVVGTVRPRTAIVATVLAMIGAAVAGRFDQHTADPNFEALQAAVAVVVAAIVAWGLRRYAIRRLGGLTGDVLGAIVEIATLAALVTMAARRY
jgi:adenosylcobinamide-GDP ribazoletransferase